jgi:tetratricopeptide (TPR) repeat protein
MPLAGGEASVHVRASNAFELPAPSLTKEELALHEEGDEAFEATFASHPADGKPGLGPDHPNVATNFNNLASLYRVQGQYAQAEPLYKQALAIDEKSLGPNHPGVATVLWNMAQLYQEMGKEEEARVILKRVAQIRAGQ